MNAADITRIFHPERIPLDTPELQWGKEVMSHVYPGIIDLFNEQAVMPSNNPTKRIQLDPEIGKKVAEKLKKAVPKIFYKKEGMLKTLQKAEEYWLYHLLDCYEFFKSKPENEKEISFIAKSLTDVVKKEDEIISHEEIKLRLNKLLALTEIFFQIKGSSMHGGGRVPHTYFDLIFEDITKKQKTSLSPDSMLRTI